LVERVPCPPGRPIEDAELLAIGFVPFEIEVRPDDVAVPKYGVGRNWVTLGDVPDSPGLYAFTVDDGRQQCVTYVGKTDHLAMVTKGRRPGARNLGRGGQRYGRPLYSGDTRRYVNTCATIELVAGKRVRHWLRPLALEQLRTEEEALIERWGLREVGWNRDRRRSS
jgi:hypothetical protein